MRELPKYYGGKDAEKKWQEFWEETGIYKFDEESEKKVYSVDTPPPTVSGSLHIGHIFSYTQAEIIIRYKRMNGYNIFYPFGFDDNGLPTERLVEKKLKTTASKIGRDAFIKECLKISSEIEKEFKELWQSMGFSVDWEQLYSTIDDRSRRISQRSFLDLYKKGYLVKKAMPTLYCPHCRTTVAQADTEDKEIASQFIDLKFEIETGDELIISTTRPELLPALVAVFVHPEDERYKNLIGKKVKPPLLDLEVEIKADEKVDKEKGTGAVMCCTFGDTTDIEWYHQYNLPLRQIIDERGRMNELAGPYAGLKVKEAREKIKSDLEENGFVVGKKDIVHPVNTHDRCGHEMEFIVKDQWFIKILDNKDELIKQADKINWYPKFMKERYINWVNNLKWDWSISRQRYYGVPFPIWYCKNCGEVILADEEDLPVNPLVDKPKHKCPKCGGEEFEPEYDVLDTWATSSVTPQINGKWGEPDDRMDKIFPMDLRPQAHDIIRTWAFYTIVKSYYHNGTVPWKNIMISGHSLTQNRGKREKISKSKNNAGMTPKQLMERYSADTIRYWTAGSRLGMDTYFSEDVLKEGRKLVTKIWNASKFAIMNLEGYKKGESGEKNRIDLWILQRLNEVIQGATDYFENYEYGLALNVIENFFWRDLCDNYIELVKGKIKDGNEDERKGSQETLYTVLLSVLKLFAPFLPHITEEIYQLYFKEFEGNVSIHLENWPEYDSKYEDEKLSADMKKVLKFVEMIRKAKSESKLSLAHPIASFNYEIIGLDIDDILPQILSLLKIEKMEKDFIADYEKESEDIKIKIKWGEKKAKNK